MRFLFGFALGLVLGAFIGLVLAPQPGSETRRVLTEQARRLRREERLAEQSGAGVVGAEAGRPGGPS